MGDLLYLEFVSRIIQETCNTEMYAAVFKELEAGQDFLVARDFYFKKNKKKAEKILRKAIGKITP